VKRDRCIRILLSVALIAPLIVLGQQPATAQSCGESSVRGNLEGEQNRVRLSLGGASTRCIKSIEGDIGSPQPYFTHEIACSTDRVAAAEGLCSATPCPEFGRFFAFRTLHRPDGTSSPAGSACVTLDQATASPGVTLAQVFAAVRRVRLPGGQIQVTPAVQGLANLTSFFWVQGTSQPPVDLPVAGSVVHAEFRVLEYRWSFGDGRTLVSTGPGTPGLDSEVATSFPRRGRYRVTVTVSWAAQAWLDGRPVGQVDGLVSQAQTSYPVAELRTILTG
jgi:hypothetical protein